MARKKWTREDFEFVAEEYLPDGRTKLTMRCGGICYVPTYCDPEAKQRAVKRICDIQYGVMLRKMEVGT